MKTGILAFKSQRKVYLSLFLVLLLVFASKPVLGIEKVVSNSADWRDVYSSMLYASLTDKQPGMFLTSAKHGTIMLYAIPISSNGTLVVSSRSQPYTVNYEALMESQGYENVEEIVTNTANLDLAERLADETDINKYIIVDDDYGYNALSAASYAVVDKYYVLFANERNIGAVDNFLTDVSPEKVLIFGQVDETVKTRLAKYSPETINQGDRFDNNIEMVKRYLKVNPTSQVLMSNGEFIEASIMSGDNPVIFIGKGSVPPQVEAYIKESNIQVAVLIGNELINSATAIRRQLGISVFVKFAQGSRTPTGPVANVEDLDKFPMPIYTVSLGIYDVLYNRATNSLWVTYKNQAGLGLYLTGTITIMDGTNRLVVGDEDPVFIDKNQYKTITYDVELESDNISVQVYTLFGEGKRSLENVLEYQGVVELIEILDRAVLNITDVEYDASGKEFIVTVENVGEVDGYVSIELIDLYINGEYVTISSPEIVLIQAGNKVKIRIPAYLSDADRDNNPMIEVKIYYGERENSLIYTQSKQFPFKLKSIDYVTYGLILVIIALILLIIFGRKKCPHCGQRNSRTNKKCKKCGQPLYSEKRSIHDETGQRHHEHKE